MKWFDTLADIFRDNRLLKSKMANVILALMAILYVTMITKGIIENVSGVGQPPLAPITIQQVRILDTNVAEDHAIFVVLHGKLNIKHCDSYLLGSIVNSNTNRVLFDKVTPIPPDALDEALTNRTPLKLNVGELPYGKYFLRGEFHMICSGKSYVVLSPLLDFEIHR